MDQELDKQLENKIFKAHPFTSLEESKKRDTPEPFGSASQDRVYELDRIQANAPSSSIDQATSLSAMNLITDDNDLSGGVVPPQNGPSVKELKML